MAILDENSGAQQGGTRGGGALAWWPCVHFFMPLE